MAIGAGQLVAVNGHNLSGDVTNVELGFEKAIVENTAILHEWRQRVSQGLKDRNFSMSAFWDAGTAEQVFRSDDEAVMTRAYGLEPGAYAHSFEGAISPRTTRETPVGELVMWSTEGFVNDQGAGFGRLLYFDNMALSAGSNNLYNTQNVDVGTVAADRKVRLFVHVHGAPPSATVGLWHVGSLTGSWQRVDSSLDVANIQNRIAPHGFATSEFEGTILRHLGLRVTTSSTSRLHMLAGDLGGNVIGWSDGSVGGIGAGGVIQPDFPGVAVSSHGSEVNVYVNDSHGLVNPTPSPNQILLRVRERGTSTFSSYTCVFVSNAGGIDRYRDQVPSAHIFEVGKEYDIEARRAGASGNTTLNGGTGRFNATVAVTIE